VRSCRRHSSRSSRAGRHRAGSKLGGPFNPHTCNPYVYSQIADVSYKRLTRTVSVPASGGNLTFWTSHDTEEHWDFVLSSRNSVMGRILDHLLN
jgi:hypothetical protein